MSKFSNIGYVFTKKNVLNLTTVTAFLTSHNMLTLWTKNVTKSFGNGKNRKLFTVYNKLESFDVFSFQFE